MPTDLTTIDWEMLRRETLRFLRKRGDFAKAVANDVVQDTLERLWREIASGVEIKHPFAWCRFTARNRAIDVYRYERHFVQMPELNDENEAIPTVFVDDVTPEDEYLLKESFRGIPIIAAKKGMTRAEYRIVAEARNEYDREKRKAS